MYFYVVNYLGDSSQIPTVETEDFPHVRGVSSVMWIPFPRSLDVHQLDYFVSSIPSHVRRSDITIIGLHPRSYQAVMDSCDILDDVAKRVDRSPVYLVRHDNGDPTIQHVSGPEVNGMEACLSLKHIRQHDVAEVVRRPGAELPQHPNIHYKGPNGDHYESFLRLGFAAQSIEDLDRIAFWLAPMLRGKRNILVDHWSMISIAYHVRLYSRFLGFSAAESVQSLRRYDEDLDLLVDRLKGTFDFEDSSGLLTGAVLLSVNSSGRLARDLLFPALERAGVVDPVGVAVARSPTDRRPMGNSVDRVRSLTTLEKSFARIPAAECTVCRQEAATLIPIQRDSYLLNLAAHIHKVDIKATTTEKSTEVINRYRDLDAFYVHKTHSDHRHHAYFVDLRPILSSNSFHKRLMCTLENWRDVHMDLVVHPVHGAARSLAQMVAKELNVKTIVSCDEDSLVRVEEFGKMGVTERERLLHAKRICLVDDVVVTGSRMRGYRNALNTVRREHNGPEVELYCLVGMARARNARALMAVSDMFHHRNRRKHFLFVESLFLPNWDEGDCRWCAELRILRSRPRSIRELTLVSRRLHALEDSEGLTKGLFLPWSTDRSSTLDRYWRLGLGSVFGDGQNADLAASVAASIQSMRGKIKKSDGSWGESQLDEVFRSPVAKVLDPQMYMIGRYYEPVLVASILRATRRHDIRAPGSDRELLKDIATLTAKRGSEHLRGELLIASALNQLPWSGDLTDALRDAHPDMAAFAESILTEDSRLS